MQITAIRSANCYWFNFVIWTNTLSLLAILPLGDLSMDFSMLSLNLPSGENFFDYWDISLALRCFHVSGKVPRVQLISCDFLSCIFCANFLIVTSHRFIFVSYDKIFLESSCLCTFVDFYHLLNLFVKWKVSRPILPVSGSTRHFVQLWSLLWLFDPNYYSRLIYIPLVVSSPVFATVIAIFPSSRSKLLPAPWYILKILLCQSGFVTFSWNKSLLVVYVLVSSFLVRYLVVSFWGYIQDYYSGSNCSNWNGSLILIHWPST